MLLREKDGHGKRVETLAYKAFPCNELLCNVDQ